MQIKQLGLPPNCKRITYQIEVTGQVKTVQNSPQKKDNHFIGFWEGCRIQLGHLNSIHLTKNSKYQDILKDNPFVSIQTPHSRNSEQQKKSKCNCKKSKCLKLYCECFSNKSYCSQECQCQGCHNVELYSQKLQKLHEQRKNKRYENTEVKGCRCTKSNCQKKYCQCFNRKVACTTACICYNCENQIHKKQLKESSQ